MANHLIILTLFLLYATIVSVGGNTEKPDEVKTSKHDQQTEASNIKNQTDYAPDHNAAHVKDEQHQSTTVSGHEEAQHHQHATKEPQDEKQMDFEETGLDSSESEDASMDQSVGSELNETMMDHYNNTNRPTFRRYIDQRKNIPIVEKRVDDIWIRVRPPMEPGEQHDTNITRYYYFANGSRISLRSKFDYSYDDVHWFRTSRLKTPVSQFANGTTLYQYKFGPKRWIGEFRNRLFYNDENLTRGDLAPTQTVYHFGQEDSFFRPPARKGWQNVNYPYRGNISHQRHVYKYGPVTERNTGPGMFRRRFGRQYYDPPYDYNYPPPYQAYDDRRWTQRNRYNDYYEYRPPYNEPRFPPDGGAHYDRRYGSGGMPYDPRSVAYDAERYRHEGGFEGRRYPPDGYPSNGGDDYRKYQPDRTHDDKQYSDGAYYDRKYDDRKYDDRKYEDRKFDDRKFEDRKFDDRKFDDRKYEDRKYEDRKYEDRKYEDRKYDDRKYDDRKYDDRKFEDRKFEDRKFEDRKFEDRKFEDRKYDDRKYDDRKYPSETTPYDDSRNRAPETRGPDNYEGRQNNKGNDDEQDTRKDTREDRESSRSYNGSSSDERRDSNDDRRGSFDDRRRGSFDDRRRGSFDDRRGSDDDRRGSYDERRSSYDERPPPRSYYERWDDRPSRGQRRRSNAGINRPHGESYEDFKWKFAYLDRNRIPEDKSKQEKYFLGEYNDILTKESKNLWKLHRDLRTILPDYEGLKQNGSITSDGHILTIVNGSMSLLNSLATKVNGRMEANMTVEDVVQPFDRGTYTRVLNNFDKILNILRADRKPPALNENLESLMKKLIDYKKQLFVSYSDITHMVAVLRRTMKRYGFFVMGNGF